MKYFDKGNLGLLETWVMIRNIWGINDFIAALQQVLINTTKTFQPFTGEKNVSAIFISVSINAYTINFKK